MNNISFLTKGKLIQYMLNPSCDAAVANFVVMYTVSWRIRIFNCIEEVPRFFFPIEFNSTFQIFNYLQFNCTPDTI